MLGDPHPLVFAAALEDLRAIATDFVTDENRNAFATFVRQTLSGRYEQVGIRSRADDSETTVQLRPRLVRFLGQFGADEALLADAADLVEQYFDSPASVPSGLALEAMRVTALHDGGERYDQYVKAYLGTDSAVQKSNILAAMYFDDPEVVIRQLEFSLSEEVQAGDSLLALSFFTYVLDDHALLYEWLDGNLDRVLAKAPAMYQPVLPQVLGGSCDQHNLDLLMDFFADRGELYATSAAKVESVRT